MADDPDVIFQSTRAVALDDYWRRPYGERRDVDAVFCVSSRSARRPESRQTLTIKMVRDGREEFLAGGQRYRVDADCYLILNDGQSCSSRGADGANRQALEIFFSPERAARTLGVEVRGRDLLAGSRELRFFEQLYLHDRTLSPLLRYIAAVCTGDEADEQWYDEQLGLLLHRMLAKHRQVLAQIDRIEATRRSTRIEIYRRLSRAKDFVLSNYDRQIATRDIADRACLSVSHLHSLFKQLYGTTPHRFLQRKRIAVASRLLVASELGIADIAGRIGMESRSSFFRAFRAVQGISPQEYRRRSLVQTRPSPGALLGLSAIAAYQPG